MDSQFKTYLQIGALAAVVLGAAGYGLYRESQKSAPQGSRPATVPPSGILPNGEVSVSTTPEELKIETLPRVVGGTSGHEARVIGRPGLRYEWEIKGGKLELGRDRDTIQWTADLSGDVILTCRGFDPYGTTLVAVKRVPIQSMPGIPEFAAVPPIITQGATARLGWTARDFTKVVLNPGNRDVTNLSGPGLEVKPTETTVYVLTATDQLGEVATREVTLKVVAAPQITALRAEAKAGVGDAFTVIGDFKGAKAELKVGSAVIARAETSPLRADLSGVEAGSTATMVVTNEAGTTVTGTLPFAVKKP